MKTKEEKIAEIETRWAQIHKTPAEPARKRIKDATEIAPEVTSRAIVRKGSLGDLSKKIWESSGRDIKSIVPPGINNQSWYLLYLKGTIEFVGNIAVGEDNRFPGWWNVVPPLGVMISYFGEGGKYRALAHAEKLKEHYK